MRLGLGLSLSSITGGAAVVVTPGAALLAAIPAGSNTFFDPSIAASVTSSGGLVSSIANQIAGIVPTLDATTTEPTLVANSLNSSPILRYNQAQALEGGAGPLGSTALTVWAILRTTFVGQGMIFGKMYNAYGGALVLGLSTGHVDFVGPGGTIYGRSDAVLNDGAVYCIIGTWSSADNTARIYVNSTTPATITGVGAGPLSSNADPVCMGADVASIGGAVDRPLVGDVAACGSYPSIPSIASLMAAIKTRAGI